MMFLQVIILLAGFLFLVKGADWFVEGAASIAKKLGIPSCYSPIFKVTEPVQQKPKTHGTCRSLPSNHQQR